VRAKVEGGLQGVRPFVVWGGLVRGVGDGNLEADGNGGRLTIEGAGPVTELADSGEDVLVEGLVSGLNDLEVGGVAGLVDDHFDDDLAVKDGESGIVLIDGDVDGVNELGGDDSGRDAGRSGVGRGIVGRFLGDEGYGLEEGGLKHRRRAGLSRRFGLCEEHGRRKREDGHNSTRHN